MKNKTDEVDWDACTWEGARRQALREWSKLPLERVIAALEEMQALSENLASQRTGKPRDLQE